MKRINSLAAAAAICLGLAPVTARAYSALYVFGDSLSDAGNVFLGTNGTEPAAPYVNGQFSNGPIWAEDLSHSLGLGTLAPSLAGGTDYAFGGATTGNSGTLSSPSLVPTLTQQLGLFLPSVGYSAPSSALYAIWIGSNDVFNIVDSGASVAAASNLATSAALTEATDIKELASAGAKNFLVPLVGDLGKTPTLTQLGHAASAAGTALALAYDAALEADLADLAAAPGISLSFLDTFTLIDSAIADPAAYGFTNVSDPCYTGPYTGGGSACASPDTYLFWDQLHPTAAGQAIIAQAALAEVPEPATLTVLAAGLVGVATIRRRRLVSSTQSI